MSLACSCLISWLECTHPSIVEGGDIILRTSSARCNRNRRQCDGNVDDVAEQARRSRRRHGEPPLMYSADDAIMCGCGPYGQDCIS